MRYAIIIAAMVWTGDGRAAAQSPALFASQPQQVIKLADRNGDGDFLDYGETLLYATNLPPDLGGMASDEQRLFVVDGVGARVLSLQDLNGDGDALDYAEIRDYGMLPQAGLSPTAAGTAVHGASVFVADSANGLLYRFTDSNGDGDALDSGECTLAAVGFTSPSAVSVRPDGRLLVAQALAASPVRILMDRDGGGDFLDFAENISYAEETSPGQYVVATSNNSAYLTKPTEGTITRLYDWTGDRDALDFGEVLLHAEGLTQPFAATAESAGSLFIAARDSAGTVYRVTDRNGDGDALDYGEVLIVALGIGQPGGIVFVSGGTECLKGDINDDGTVDLNDVLPFVDVLLGLTTIPDPCPVDCNGDGFIDAADIQSFIEALL